MTCTEEWIKENDTEFFTKVWTAESAQAVVLYIHGYIEHVARYDAIFPLWNERGVSVVAFDQRGFGQTALNKEHNKGAGERYGKTSSKQQLEDISFFVKWTGRRFEGLPLFLAGQSMGGALALGTAIHQTETAKRLSGVISSSPLLLQAVPAPKIQRLAGGLMSKILPWSSISTEVKAQDLSHDPAVAKAYVEDPLVIERGTLRGVSDMLNFGESIVRKDFGSWPAELPVLVVHGTADKVTLHEASQQFVEKITADDKTFSPYPGGYHELHNEPDGGREKVVEQCTSWLLARCRPKSEPEPELPVGQSKL